ncbi:hypothetical protein [Leptolyngbya sp. FACHB-261]|uniref:hypothetical protein n=1 Tax=Leptolyngbya sp. FACHB-261 TaxID=2692806 RepID=UPI001689C71C|nr:hypothetical protein [Leptolyngbya sp. FACHB-261]MBD2103935.1 hypothetical protein [Leptolyngbya sp. FACHB-261]
MLQTKLYVYWKWIALAIFSAILSIFLFSTPNIANAQNATFSTDQNPLCQQLDFEKLGNKERPTLDSIIIETGSRIIPDGETITVKISKPSPANTVFCARIYTNKEIKPVRVITAKNSSDGNTILTLRTPSIDWRLLRIEAKFDLASIPFDESTGKYRINSPDTYVSQDVKISSWPFSVVGSIIAIFVAYSVAATAVYRLKNNQEKGPSQNMLGYLDLVAFTSEKSGKANISNLQITWFTLIVFGLLVHVLLRTGELSPISDNILWLLGISATGKIISRGVDFTRNRLSLENRAWLYYQGWLKDTGPLKAAKWGDLIMTDSSFDVYKYQLLIFSLIVGITLTVSGLNALTTFNLPQGFVSLLGLSNAVYIFGKTTSPNLVAELNEHLNQLRGLEKRYSEDPEAYRMKARDVASMLVLVYGEELTKFNSGITNSSLEPRLVD